jgi:hypothetical protein
MVASTVPVGANHNPRVDDRVVHPYNQEVYTHVPIVAGYEPVPKPVPCDYGDTFGDDVFAESFEDPHNFTFEETALAAGSANLWGVTSFAGPGGDDGHEGEDRLYFGNADRGHYWELHPAGVAATPWMQVPEEPTEISFNTKWEVEYLAGYDHMFVEAETADGQVHVLCTTNPVPRADPAGQAGQSNFPACSPHQTNPCQGLDPVWETRSVQVPAVLLGEEVRFRFTFDAADSAANGYTGWMVDDVGVGSGLP